MLISVRLAAPLLPNLTSNETALIFRAEEERGGLASRTLPAPVSRVMPGVNPRTNIFPYPNRIPIQSSSNDTQPLMSLLRSFRERFARWPTNIAEVAAFARVNELPVPTARFDDAIFSESSGRLTVTYDDGRGKLSLSGFAGSSGISRLQPQRPLRTGAEESVIGGARLGSEDSRTFIFILRNFRARNKRWPANIAEVKAFATDLANLQPEFPVSYDTESYSNAVFTTKSDGGLQMSYRNGTMKVGAPK